MRSFVRCDFFRLFIFNLVSISLWSFDDAPDE